MIRNTPFNANQLVAQALAPADWKAQGFNAHWQLDGYALCAHGS